MLSTDDVFLHGGLTADGKRSRMVRIFHYPVDGFGHRRFNHDPGRSKLSPLFTFNDVMRRKIIERNGGNVAHATRTSADVFISLVKEFFHHGQHAIIISIYNNTFPDSHNFPQTK